jgi:ribose/xylose/arabinose/galactoside ABC-type transport system permease subunit
MVSFSKQFSMLIIVSCGQAFALITRGIDMSIGAMMAWTSMVLGAVTVGTGNFALGLLAAAIVVLLFGLLNGVVIGGFGADAFIITLGMMYVCRGSALLINDGQPYFGFPDAFQWLTSGTLFGIPVMFIFSILIALFFQTVLTRTRTGRHITALGGNREGAIFSGVNVSFSHGAAYMLSAILAGVAGVVMASRMFSAQPNMGMSAHLEATSAAIIGGISLSGGRGDIFGVLLGAFLLTVVANGMNIIGVSSYNQDTVLGLVLIVALILDRFRQIAMEQSK